MHFETSCKPEAQKLFDRGMLYQHSFWYRASQKTFEEVLKADPECAIAYWGIALSLLWNPHTAPAAKNLAEGAAALEKAKSVGAKTERERDYLAALGAMYADYDKVDHRTRLLAYAKAMEAAGRALSERRRSADPLCAGAQHLRARRPTRPTPTSSRARPSWRRSPSASRSIPASRTT